MSQGATATQPGGLAGVRTKRLFVASCISLIATAVVFSTITSMMGQIRDQFGLTNTQVGFWVGTTTIVGFPIAILFLGPLCDFLGMRTLMRIAFVCHLAGVLLMVLANGIVMLGAGALLLALGNGTVEAACNPLTATLFPDKKTEKLNRFHMWWPGGLVLGGLAAYGIDKIDVAMWKGMGVAAWQIKTLLVLIPTIIYGILFTGQKFPLTERVQAGISFGGMIKATITRPLFIILFFCMMMTASLELGPGRWMGEAMKGAMSWFGDNAGVLALVYISALMAVLRFYAGPVVHKLSNTGLLLMSAILGGLGLFLLTYATGSAFMVFVAATVFAFGVCYFWPTMLGTASEQVPKGGALALAMLGGVGMLAVGFLAVPIMGLITDRFGHDKVPADQAKACLKQVVDTYPAMAGAAKDDTARAAIDGAARIAKDVLAKADASGGSLPRAEITPGSIAKAVYGEIAAAFAGKSEGIITTSKALREAESAAPESPPGKTASLLLRPADEYGTLIAFRCVSALSIILVIVFAAMYIRDRRMGGYKAEKIL